MTQIFISYRTEDEPFAAALFDHELSRELGPEAVFFASRSIDLGADWEKAMFAAVSGSKAVLVIIGARWLTATDKKGNRRLDDPKDYVRREVELGIHLDKQVIPVHLERRHRLDRTMLPSAMEELAVKQSAVVGFRNSKPDIIKLVSVLRRQIPSLSPNREDLRPLGAAAGARVDNSTHSTTVGQVNGSFVQGRYQIGGIVFGGEHSGI